MFSKKTCEKPMKKLLILKKLILVFVICSVFTGCSFSKSKETLTAPPLQEIPEIKFFTFDVKKGEIKKEIKDTVKIEPASETPIFSKYGGWLVKSYGKVNEFVNKGDLLVEFDSDSLENKLKQQELALEKAQLNKYKVLEEIQREIQLLSMDLQNVQEKLESKKELRSNLLKDDKNYDVRILNDEIQDLKNQIARYEINLDTTNEKYELTNASLQIDISNYELQIENTKKQLEETKIYAPKDGMIFNVAKVEEGEYIGAYRSLFTIVSIEDVQFKYTGMNANKFEVGMDVTIILDKDELPGKVISSPSYYAKDMPTSVKESVIMTIEGLTVEKLMGLKSDARVNLVLEEKDDVVVIPKNVLNNHIGNKYVYVIENGMKKQRFVETGIDNNIDIEIIKGLNPGDKVVEG